MWARAALAVILLLSCGILRPVNAEINARNILGVLRFYICGMPCQRQVHAQFVMMQNTWIEDVTTFNSKTEINLYSILPQANHVADWNNHIARSSCSMGSDDAWCSDIAPDKLWLPIHICGEYLGLCPRLNMRCWR